MIRLSVGTIYQMLLALAATHDDHVIRVYSGPIPESAESAPAGTYLGYITREGLPPGAGHGLHFGVSPSGYVGPQVGLAMVLTGIASGVAGWARLSAYNDPPETIVTERLDFEVFQFGAGVGDGNGLTLTNLEITADLIQPITSFYYSIPH